MRTISIAALAAALIATPASAGANLAEPDVLLDNCKRIASGRLGLPAESLSLETPTPQTDGPIQIYGVATDGLDEFSFQCNFTADGEPMEFWNDVDRNECPGDLSEADRWLFPGC